MKNRYSSWVDTIYDEKESDRVGTINAVLDSFAQKSKKAEGLADAVTDLKEFEKPSFLTHVHFVPMKGCREGIIEHMMFSGPVVAVKHKKLPLVLAIAKDNKTIPSAGYAETMASVEDGFDIKQLLSWSNTVSYLSDSEKKSLSDLLIDGIKAQRRGKKESDVWLSDFVRSGKEFRVIGFAANAPYINVDRAYGDTRPIWVHPWGIPALLLRHKELPVILMISPAIRLNENLLGNKNMEGYTG